MCHVKASLRAVKGRQKTCKFKIPILNSDRKAKTCKLNIQYTSVYKHKTHAWVYLKTLPLPKPSDSTHMRPPMASVSLLQMANPKPEPPNLRVGDASTCECTSTYYGIVSFHITTYAYDRGPNYHTLQTQMSHWTLIILKGSLFQFGSP